MQNVVNLVNRRVYDGMMQVKPEYVVTGLSTEQIFFGKAVGFAPAAAMGDIPKAITRFTAGQQLYGIAPADTTLERLADPATGIPDSAPFGAFGANRAIPVVRRGKVWVRTDQPITSLANSVFIRNADVTGTPATVTALAAEFAALADQVGLTVTVNVTGLAPQLVTYAGAVTTAAHAAAELNAQLIGVSVAVVAGDLVITTDEVGAHMEISITAGTSVVAWQAPVDGTGIMTPPHIAARGSFRDIAAGDYTEFGAGTGIRWINSLVQNGIPYGLLDINLP